jgi:hypothetical protein
MNKVIGREFSLTNPMSLVLLKGHIGFWQNNNSTKRNFIPLDAAQANFLLQFVQGPIRAESAAAAAGIDYGPEVDRLVTDLLIHGVLTELIEVADTPLHKFAHPFIDENEIICVVQTEAIDLDCVRSMRNGLHNSALIGNNILSEGFTGTRGFGVKFRREMLPLLQAWLPWTKRFFTKALDHSVAIQLNQHASELKQPNAFYFNALLIPPGAGTTLHVDASLDGRTQPQRVTVLYIDTVASSGGRLYLYNRQLPIAVVNPRPGMLVHFRGDLTHGVSNTAKTDGMRSSLVLEQYCLEEEELYSCPSLELITAPRAAQSAR